MTFSQEPYQHAISRNEPIRVRETSYFAQRLRHHVFGRVVAAFAERAEHLGLTKAKLAQLLDKDAGQINRLLSLPSNMTLETLSNLSLAMGYEPEICLVPLDEPSSTNYVHPSLLKHLPQSEPMEFNITIGRSAGIARPVTTKLLEGTE